MHVSWLAKTWWLLRRAFIAVYEDGCLGIAKGAAYSGLLAFFPVLTTVALALVQLKADEAADLISRFLFEVVPPGTEELVRRRFTERGETPETLLVFAGLVSLWAASSLILSLVEGFNAVYKLPSNRPLVRGRLVAMGLVFSAAGPALGATALMIFGTRSEVWIVRWLGMIASDEQLAGGILFISTTARYLLVFGAIVATTMLLYFIGPARRHRFRDIWPGALIATLLWIAATSIFSWYVRNIADYNVLYGSIGAVIALILWMYLLAVIALYGCAYNAEREHLAETTAMLTG
ncbi:MAG: YihY/virulence factor BrkB family protein [bacterium]|nr:YihY/virulence factor BrkB family protein [bacterium]